MKNLKIFVVALLLFSGLMKAQDLIPSIPDPGWYSVGYIHYIYTLTMADSTGTTYSTELNTAGYIPNNLKTYPLIGYAIGSGTRDSVKIIIQGRMITKHTSNTFTYSTWAAVDTISVTFNKVDGVAYAQNIDFNGARPDQIRFQVIGASSVNRKTTVLTAILILKKI